MGAIGLRDPAQGWRFVGPNVLRAPALNVRARLFLFVLRWLVGKSNNAGTERLCFDKFQGRVAPVLEEAFTASQHNRIDQEPILINEIVWHQRADKRVTAVNHDILTGLLLQFGDFFSDTLRAFNQR